MSIDIAIVIVFLAVNLGLGIWSGKGIKTIKEYAVGNRDFSAATIGATIIATWISGSFFTVCVAQTYKEGIWFLPAAIADIVDLLIIGYLFGPRLKEFFGSLSVAETMGNLFGKHVRLITAISSIAQAIAMTALQIKVFSTIFSYFFGVSSLYATCISSVVVILYSAWGGIRAVTFTDLFQFFTFGIFIPMFLVFVWQTVADIEAVTVSLQTNPLLDYTQLVNWRDPKFFPNLIMLFWFLIPSLNSPLFQRILMNKSTKQIRQSFSIAALGYGFIILSTCAIGLLILSINPNLDSDNIIMHMLDQYSIAGLKGIAIIGIIAMIMSTADSWINTGAVIFAHDLCKPLGITFKNELLLARVFSLVIGFSALLLVIFNENLFKLFSLQANFYMPIVTVPLILAIFGFRSSARVVIISMISGALSAILWKIYMGHTGIDSVIPAMFINLFTLITSHYILKEPGGWVGIKDESDLKEIRRERKSRLTSIKKFLGQLCNLMIFKINIIDYCKKHIPRNDMTYVYFGCTVMMTTAVTSASLDRYIYQEHLTLINFLQAIAFLIATIFVTHKIWTPSFRAKYIGIIWCISIFFSLVFISSFFALINQFSQISVVILILNLTIIGLLMSWQMTVMMIISGVLLALFSYEYLVGPAADLHNSELNVGYILFAIGGLLFTFLKPKQERQELIEETNAHLKQTLAYHNIELQKAIDLKSEFLRNLEHEAHTPITGITSLGQVLWENYDQFTDQQKRDATKDIANSAQKLTSLVNNMIDLSKLSNLACKLNIQEVNLSELLSDRLETCKRMYLQDKELEIVSEIGDNIIVNCDSYYISGVLDNLIINAIQYTQKGKVTICLYKGKNTVEFSIKDDGIGIPTLELHDIFGAFVVSSKTRTPAGGRGVGLALCKKSIEVHSGKIWAESNGEKGAVFRFTLPIIPSPIFK